MSFNYESLGKMFELVRNQSALKYFLGNRNSNLFENEFHLFFSFSGENNLAVKTFRCWKWGEKIDKSNSILLPEKILELTSDYYGKFFDSLESFSEELIFRGNVDAYSRELDDLNRNLSNLEYRRKFDVIEDYKKKLRSFERHVKRNRLEGSKLGVEDKYFRTVLKSNH